MTAYDVDLDELTAVVSAMEACGRALADHTAALDAAHRRLHTGWSGLASEAHTRSHEGWRASFEVMAAALTGLRSLGDAARTNYSAAVEANQLLWRQVT